MKINPLYKERKAQNKMCAHIKVQGQILFKSENWNKGNSLALFFIIKSITIIINVFFFKFQTSADDTSQFDTKFTKQTPVDSPVESNLSASMNMIFKVRYYNRKIICIENNGYAVTRNQSKVCYLLYDLLEVTEIY